MDKSPEAFRTISEVADELDVPQHVLRFWETRFPSIRPLKRGGGRRYYRRDDVELLKGIRQLLYGEGYTIRGVQRILKTEGGRFVQSVGRGEQAVAAPDPGERGEAEPTTLPLGLASDVDGDPVHLVDRALREDDFGLLRAVFDELAECTRVLDDLLPPAGRAAQDERALSSY
jgi:DNA-binding transcriptional MerR regulator